MDAGDRIVRTWTDDDGVTRQEYANGIIATVKASRRKPRVVKAEEHFLMLRLAALADLNAPTIAPYWLLAVHVLWHWKVRGQAMSLTVEACAAAGVSDTRRRRRAVAGLKASGLFLVIQEGNQAPRVSPRPTLAERILLP